MSDDTVKEAIKKIFVHPEVSERAVDLLVPNHAKPRGWSRRSNAPYFKECYAIQLRVEIDKMIEDGQNRVYMYDQWPHMTPTSVYLRINQGLRYLTTFMDPDGKYGKFLERVAITRKRNYGVELKLITDTTGVKDFAPQQVVPSTETPRWKQRIEDWLEKSEPGGEPFVLTNLMLSPDEVRELKLQFHGLTSVQHSITATTIKLLKLNL